MINELHQDHFQPLQVVEVEAVHVSAAQEVEDGDKKDPYRNVFRRVSIAIATGRPMPHLQDKEHALISRKQAELMATRPLGCFATYADRSLPLISSRHAAFAVCAKPVHDLEAERARLLLANLWRHKARPPSTS